MEIDLLLGIKYFLELKLNLIYTKNRVKYSYKIGKNYQSIQNSN